MALKGFHSWSNPFPLNKRMCRGMACVGGTLSSLAACAPAAQAKVALWQKKQERHIFLLGSTGSGKSSTANLLFTKGSSADDGPFAVSHAGESMTAEICPRTTPSGLTIVDTPGLGDVPPMKPGETQEQHKAHSRQRSTDFVDRISKELHAKGGLVLDVVKGGRITDLIVRHRQALSAVLGGSCSTVLVLTNIPEIFKYTKDTAKEQQKEKREALLEWARQQRESIEERSGVRYAAVLAVSNSDDLHPSHVAHPANFAAEVADLQEHCCLAPGAACIWSKLVSDKHSLAVEVQNLETDIRRDKRTIMGTEQQRAQKSKISSVASWFLVGSVIGTACIGPVALGPACALLCGCIDSDEKVKRLSASLRTWTKTLEDKVDMLAERSQGRSSQQLQAEAEQYERLVFDD